MYGFQNQIGSFGFFHGTKPIGKNNQNPGEREETDQQGVKTSDLADNLNSLCKVSGNRSHDASRESPDDNPLYAVSIGQYESLFQVFHALLSFSGIDCQL